MVSSNVLRNNVVTTPPRRLCQAVFSLAGLKSGAGEAGRPLVLAEALVSCLSAS